MILIIEDDSSTREMLLLFMEITRIPAVAAKGFHDGLEKINAFRPSIILLDMILPDGDGVDLVKNCHSKFPNIDVIVMSAMCEKRILPLLQGIKIKEFIAKPFSIEKLEESIRACQSYPVSKIVNG